MPMKKIIGYFLAIAIGGFLGWYLCHKGMGGVSTPPCTASPLEVKGVRDSSFAYHIPPGHKTQHLSKSNNEFAIWTFPQDASIDSVVAFFPGASPFASNHFEFADSAASSGLPVVSASGTTYTYTITIYP